MDLLRKLLHQLPIKFPITVDFCKKKCVIDFLQLLVFVFVFCFLFEAFLLLPYALTDIHGQQFLSHFRTDSWVQPVLSILDEVSYNTAPR